MEINGVAHIFVTAGDFEASKAFYMKLLPFLGLKEVMNAAGVYYAVGGRTGFAVRAPSPDHVGERFVQDRVGLHHARRMGENSRLGGYYQVAIRQRHALFKDARRVARFL